MYEAFFLYYKFNVVIFYSIKLDIVIFILNRERTFIKKKKKKGQGLAALLNFTKNGVVSSSSLLSRVWSAVY